ncbi:hypothetical protein EVAR_71281_1 [Eumeta japonica]|uniref:Serine/threonine-protein phosphatase 4 regulatory subunit 3-like central domain-containing protein n=1 Tax=Eumeta variegata TaxID=151549 RepID=A0A4C1TCH0_EUMVA|nr:hypothetical protein EVAR_71281_1 [Eumeta japonica]
MTTDTRRRVKLYALNAERQWDDRGTGHVSSNYVDRLKGEFNIDSLFYYVQGKDPSVEITQDIVEESEDERFEDMSDTAPPIELPPCELARLEDISEVIQNCLTTPLRKEKLSMALESENYIKKLLNLFHVCEDLDNTEGLHHLFEIFKNIFLLNKNALFEIMFAEDTIFDVVGCLEYDPSVTQPKKHRQYLKQWAKFREAVPIKNQDLLAKIHQTFRVQYIQDIILPTPSKTKAASIDILTAIVEFSPLVVRNYTLQQVNRTEGAYCQRKSVCPVVDAFIRNNGRYNLLESAILELFEFVKLEDIKTLCVYFVETFSKIFDEIEYVQTFKYLKNRYDQYQERIKDRDKMGIDTGIPIIRGNRFRRDQRQMEEEEEMWFNEEEDLEELETYNSVMKLKLSLFDQNNIQLKHFLAIIVPLPKNGSQTSSQLQQNHRHKTHSSSFSSIGTSNMLSSTSVTSNLNTTTTSSSSLSPTGGGGGGNISGSESASGLQTPSTSSSSSNCNNNEQTSATHLDAAAAAAAAIWHCTSISSNNTLLHNYQQQQQLNLNSTLRELVELKQQLAAEEQQQELALGGVGGGAASTSNASSAQSTTSPSANALTESAVAAAATQLLSSMASSEAVAAVAAAAVAAVAASVSGVTTNTAVAAAAEAAKLNSNESNKTNTNASTVTADENKEADQASAAQTGKIS